MVLQFTPKAEFNQLEDIVQFWLATTVSTVLATQRIKRGYVIACSFRKFEKSSQQEYFRTINRHPAESAIAHVCRRY